jgi:hypothetical protein
MLTKGVFIIFLKKVLLFSEKESGLTLVNNLPNPLLKTAPTKFLNILDHFFLGNSLVFSVLILFYVFSLFALVSADLAGSGPNLNYIRFIVCS